MAADVDYLVVWDRTDRSAEDTLGRFELTLADALPYVWIGRPRRGPSRES